MATTNWNQSYSDISTVVCRFFLNGNCRYGEMCRYSHATETVNHENAAIRQSEKRNSDNDNNNNHSTIVTAATSNLRNFIDAPEFIPSKFQSKYEPAVSDDNQNEESDNAEFQDAIDHSPMLQVEGVEATMPPANATFSYAQIVSGGTYMNENHDIYPNVMDSSVNYQPMPFVDVNAATTLCPYLNVAFGEDGTVYCPYGDRCAYVHGDRCSICNSYCLHPTDEEKRKAHETECMKILEKDMEHSFAVARSKDKTCGICFEVITEKADREHRFGILPNCNHIFCLQCIRKWRQAKNFDSTITRACPECRVTSNYVCPSLYWVDTKEEKDKLLSEYKTALNQQNCKYFKQGKGTCPFGNKCFYKHALADGKLVDVGVPRRRFDLNGENGLYEQLVLWNFMEARERARDFSSDGDYYDDDISIISSGDSDESDEDDEIDDADVMNQIEDHQSM